MKKIILGIILFFGLTNLVNADDYSFSGTSLDNNFAGIYSSSGTINGYTFYENTDDSMYLFVASTYNGGPPYLWCVSDDLTDYAVQNCYFEKTTELLNITGLYDGKIYPYDNNEGTISLYSTGGTTPDGTDIVVSNNAFVNLAPDFFYRLSLKMQDKDFIDFLSILFIWLILLLQMFTMIIVGVRLGYIKAKSVFYGYNYYEKGKK